MYIQIKVQPKSKENAFVEKLEDETFKFKIKAAPEKGRANKELINFLAAELNIKKDEILIISGHTDSRKLLKIPDNTKLPW